MSLPSQGGGTLTLKTSGAGTKPVYLGRAGVYVPASELNIWAGIQAGKTEPMGEELVLRNVESGSYSLCSGEPVRAALMVDQSPPAGACVSGELAPGGELVLDGRDVPRPSLPPSPSPPAR